MLILASRVDQESYLSLHHLKDSDQMGSIYPKVIVMLTCSEAIQKKPRQGQPCNGCGLCCLAEVCELGKELGDDQHCKALIHEGEGRFACGLVSDPYRFLPPEKIEGWLDLDRLGGHGEGEAALKSLYADLLGAGKGCDSEDEAISAFLDEARKNKQLPLILVEV